MNTTFNLSRGFRLSVSTIALTSIASLFSVTASATDADPSKPVTVFQHVNYNGKSLSVGEGDVSFRTIRRSSVGNDRISSIQIDTGYQVLACEHGGFRGRCDLFTNDTSDLRDIQFNDVISSLSISKASDLPVTVYKHVNYRGNSLSIGEGTTSIADLKNSTVGNDTISSILIKPGYEVVACQHSGGRGQCETFASNTSDLRTIAFNDVISSLTVQAESTDTGENSPPVANDFTITTLADVEVQFDLGEWVTDPDGDALFTETITDLTMLDGVFTDLGNSLFNFDPRGQFPELFVGDSQTISFTYQVTDSSMATDTGTYNIIVLGTAIDPAYNTYEVGQTGPGGGTVFQINEHGTSGLEYAPDYISVWYPTPDTFGQDIAWGCEGTNTQVANFGGVGTGDTPNFTGVDDGLTSSNILIDEDNIFDVDDICVHPAAEAANAYSLQTSEPEVNDWYLPSIKELYEISFYYALPTSLWSSTPHTSSLAWVILPNGELTQSLKDDTSGIGVLPIRTF